jgi:hypothetical protein
LEVHHHLQVVLKEAEEAMTDLNVEEKEDTGEAAVDVVEVVEKASIVNEVVVAHQEAVVPGCIEVEVVEKEVVDVLPL